MPPTLRSSATTTPTRNAKTASSGVASPPSPPRKQHQCKTCGRPRVGHPRQGCPFTDSGKKKEPEAISDALESMNIDSSPVTAGRRSRRRSSPEKKPELFPDASLASLSTNSKEIVDNLIKPGIMSDLADDEDCGEIKRKIIESMTPKKKNVSPRVRMPGTLQTPTASFFDLTQDAHNGEPQSTPPTTPLNNNFQQHRPVVRSLSIEEREAFLADLNIVSKLPPACVYVFPMRDIPSIKRSAEKAGFHACVVDVTQGSRAVNKKDGWLILGREKRAVHVLKAELESRGGQDEPDGRRRKSGGTLRAVAGGAVVGAVATFTGLAFS